MFNISSFLEKFSKNIKSDEIYKKQILEIITDQTQLNFSPKDLEIKDYVLYIKTSPTLKNKIFTNKQLILDDIAKSLSIKIIDIR